MILQLHISLKNRDSSRTVLVKETMTFEQLHNLIQTIFQHHHTHSYVFQILLSNGMKVQDVHIGFSDCDLPFNLRDDEEELLKKWLFKKQDEMQYQMFSDSNEETIEYSIRVEKLLSPSVIEQYPQCIDGKNELDSLGISTLLNEATMTQLLIDRCNDLITQSLDLFESRINWERSFKSAALLYKLKPWQYLNEQQLFVVEQPLTKEPLFCSIVGHSEKTFGLVVYLEYSREFNLHLQYIHKDEYLLYLTSINVNFCAPQNLEQLDHILLQENNININEYQIGIQFRNFKPGYFPWIPDELDMMNLQIVMEQTIEITKKCHMGWQLPTFSNPNLYYGRKIEYKGNIPHWVDTIVNVEAYKKEKEILELSFSEIELARLKRNPTISLEIELDLFYLPEASQEAPWERPAFPLKAVAIEREIGKLLFENTFYSERDAFLAQSFLHDFLLTNEIKPKAIYVTEEMKCFLQPLTDILNIPLYTQDILPRVQHLKQQIFTHK